MPLRSSHLCGQLHSCAMLRYATLCYAMLTYHSGSTLKSEGERERVCDSTWKSNQAVRVYVCFPICPKRLTSCVCVCVCVFVYLLVSRAYWKSSADTTVELQSHCHI